MSPPLFLVDDLPAGDGLLLSGDEGRHAARVLRLRRGEAVLVANGRGGVLDCVVTTVRGDVVDLVIRRRRHVPGAQPQLVVVQALAKGDRGEFAVEVLTELGVDGIVPWSASRSIVQWRGDRGDKALARWRSTAREAGKQSRRPRLPVIGELESTAQVAARLAAAARGLVLHEEATEPLATTRLPLTGSVVVVVGPEGGVAPDELDAFAAAGASAVRLGDAVLRTSTAGAAALAALSLRTKRWA